MATTAAQMAAYIYPDQEDPEGAFSWWLSPCGGTNLVPDEIKKIFGILSTVAGGISSFKPPKKIGKGSGKKDDDGNPTDQSKPRAGGGGTTKKKKCNIKPAESTVRVGEAKNTLRRQSCVGDKTQKDELVITSVVYAAGAVKTQVAKTCDQSWSQACFHYSSAIRVNPSWATLVCPPEAAITSRGKQKRPVVAEWNKQHSGTGWLDQTLRDTCERDEYPPIYMLGPSDTALINSGKAPAANQPYTGQLIRLLPDDENSKAGGMWRQACFKGPTKALSDREFRDKFNAAPASDKKKTNPKPGVVQTMVQVTVNSRPEFTISSWGQAGNPPQDDGLRDNPCWPRARAPNDPMYNLLTYDPRYGRMAPPNDYKRNI